MHVFSTQHNRILLYAVELRCKKKKKSVKSCCIYSQVLNCLKLWQVKLRDVFYSRAAGQKIEANSLSRLRNLGCGYKQNKPILSP